ncbi:MAG: EAL domain-containing protein [Gammaproteobacteria bacterium]|nr:EAL domain-containing protein [Gammaproteobacteria bacterium]
MNRGFYSYSLLTMIALVVVSATVIVAFTVVSVRDQAIATADARLVSAHETTLAQLAVRAELLEESALSLSLDPRLRDALLRAKPERIASVLASHHAVSLNGLLLVVSGDGVVLGRTGADNSVKTIDRQLLFAPGAVPLVVLNNMAYQITFASIQVDSATLWAGVAMPLNQSFLNRLRELTGVNITLSSDQNASVISTRVGGNIQDSLALDVPMKSQGLQLDFEYSLARQAVLRGFWEFAMKLAALAFAITGFGILVGLVILGAITKRLVSAPLRQLRAAVGRVHKGIYTEEVIVAGDHAIARLARAFNSMQAEIGERESRILHHAEYDSLTGLTNRGVVSDRLKAMLARAQRNGSTTAAMLIDIERFSDINSLGNEIGDAVLQEVARRLASNTRATDLLARVGGDEFLIVVEDMEDRLAAHIFEFLADTLEKPINVDGRSISLRVHIGAALFPNHCDSPEGLRRLANVALATAKETDQRVVMYEPGQDERQLRELAVLNDLKEAISDGQLFLHYQPKIDMQTRNVEQVEALVRWQHPQLGFIPPDEFIGLLEQNNKIHLLTDWVLKTAVEQVRSWTGRGFDLSVAVNISANDLLDMSLSQRIGNLLHHYLVDPKRITVEVTESAVMQEPEQASLVLQTLRELGIKISIDDFGTGQTSLSLLKKLPLNELKIDQSFVRNLRADSGDGIIIKSTVDLGHNMGLVVVAEGVENTYAWNLLKSYGCDSVQGYLVSKPLSSERLEAWYLRLQAKQASKLDLSFVDTEAEPEETAAAAPAAAPKPEQSQDLLTEIFGDTSS